MGALDLVRKGVQGVKNAPFFSKADVVLDELQRGKGAGNEFLGELVKKGAKPNELRERGIEKALKGKPKMTKAEVQKIFESNPPPRVREEVRGGYEYREALDRKAQEMIGDEDVGFDDLYGRDKERAEAAVEQEFGYNPETRYDTYKTPGGENYREILLKIPQRGLNEIDKRNLMLYEADMRRGKELDPWHQKQYSALKEKQAAGSQDYYHQQHWGDTPNVLAHIRVQDYISPTYTKRQAEDIGRRIAEGMGVADHRNLGSGSIGIAIKNGYVTPKEAAQYADFRKFQGVDTTGAKQKVLLVDEIQSDWHQEARDLRRKEIKRIMDETGVDKKTATAQVPEDFGYRTELNTEGWSVRSPNPYEPNEVIVYDNSGNAVWSGTNSFGTDRQVIENVSNKLLQDKVPDAPFKKNWHELAMKRVLDYAAENGYDSIAITPGAEQAKRYDLSKHLNEINYGKNPDGTFSLTAVDKRGKPALNESSLSEEQLQDTVGKDLAQRIIAGEGNDFPVGSISEGKKSLSGLDLVVGGEGKQVLYDTMLPKYLNTLGSQYGTSVGQMDLPLGYTEESGRLINDAYARGTRADIDRATQQAQMQTLPVHRFDITPQLREEIKNKGLPLYSKMAAPDAGSLAAGSGAATIGSQMFDENNEQQVQNPVHFTENPDAMLLELMQRN